MLLMRKSAMKCGRRRFQPLLRCLHPGNGAVWVIYSQIYQSRHTKRTLSSHIIKADKMARGLRGGNIGEEPFFFKSDGAFISGDLVKPELYLRKNYMIAPGVSSPDRIGKNALIDRDYSDVFTACSVQALSNPEIRSRHGFSAFRAHGFCLLLLFRFSEWNTWRDARPTPSESSSPRRRRGMRGLRRFCPLPTPR